MRADVTWKSTVEEAALITELIQEAYVYAVKLARLVAATEEERKQAAQRALRLEGLIRTMGATLPIVSPSSATSWGGGTENDRG